jgi:hypothetical protein
VDVVEGARLKVEHSYEVMLRESKNPAGAIFALKQFGWTDKQEIDQRVLSATVVLELTDERREMLMDLIRSRMPEVGAKIQEAAESGVKVVKELSPAGGEKRKSGE